MLLQQVQVFVGAGQEAAFEAALMDVRQRLFVSAGFRGFAVAQGAEDPATYLVQVRWETPAELAEAADSGRWERCWEPVRPLFARPPLVDHWFERPSLDFTGPGTDADIQAAFH